MFDIDLFKLCISNNSTNKEFLRQRSWERYYLEVASLMGCILFWLEKQSNMDSHAYAATTRFELGQWMARSNCVPGIGISVGADPGFQALNVIQYDYSIELPGKILFNSISDVCEDAVKIACNNYKKNKSKVITPIDLVTKTKNIEIIEDLESIE
jgi:hypothetical protein